MFKKLLYKTSRAYLTFSVLVLSVSAPAFYYTIEHLYMKETDETLLSHKNEFLKYTLPTLTISEIPSWNKYNSNVKIEAYKSAVKDSLYYTSYYDSLDAEVEPYRAISTPITIQQQLFTYTAQVNLVETEGLLKSIAYLFIAIIFILLAGLFFITRKMSAILWKPFYQTLTQIENFEIDKNNQPHFPNTDIEEFNRLNHSINKLIERNITIYKSQREFIENAAHELQTPLAIFQAKIDLLVQHPDITQEQFLILHSLNDNISRLNRLNKNLLLLSKIEGDSYSDIQNISFKELFEKHIDFFIEQAKSKNITIETNFSKDFEIKSNPVLAEIFLNNLFLNAIKHNISNGKIIVELSNSSFSIANTGPTSTLDKERLFSRFSKINPSQDGTGLGLSIVKKIADINHWTISYSFSDSIHLFSVSIN